MRICGRIEKILIIVVCVCLSIIYLISKPNTIFVDLNERQISFESNDESIVFKPIHKNHMNCSNCSKWTVLSDGTVVHLGNFSELLFKNINFIINEVNTCEDFSPNSVKLLIFIESEAINFERREAIRQTWAQRSTQKLLNFKIVFLLGLHHSEGLNSKVQVCYNVILINFLVAKY